jgi:hypothetical protein
MSLSTQQWESQIFMSTRFDQNGHRQFKKDWLGTRKQCHALLKQIELLLNRKVKLIVTNLGDVSFFLYTVVSLGNFVFDAGVGAESKFLKETTV